MRVQTRVIREGRVLYLLEDVTLPEGPPLVVTIEVPAVYATPIVDEDGDVLGFDPEDEKRLLAEGARQRQALLAMAGTASSGLTDVSERHDYYIYVEPHEQQRMSEDDEPTATGLYQRRG
ncbi:MAG: hypothetical protein SXV54_11920 [Chloroflexota bacterium]|nr:hypothetical protein [Chloroflexota bacterium]